MVVQDGLGAQLNVKLDRPAVLRVKIEPRRVRSVLFGGTGRNEKVKAPAPTRLHLIPHRWWPALSTVAVPKGQSPVEFRGLGGPLRKGLIAASGPGGSERLRVVGRYDLDQSAEAVITGAETTVSPYDLPEAAGIEAWSVPARASQRLFYAAMSPIALFWPVVGEDQPLRFVQPSHPFPPVALKLPTSGAGSVRGFAPHAFLPVLVESRSGGSWLGWTNGASEYDIAGLPSGLFRARALDLLGAPTFASGAVVRDGSTAVPSRLWDKINLDEPESREVRGFVRWESGVPAAKAAVLMQNTYNFRKFLRRVETDENGYFRFSGVPGDEQYFFFALPPGEENAVRDFRYFAVESTQREVWQTATVHPHRVVGRPPATPPTGATVQLVLVQGNGERTVSSLTPGDGGRFAFANVPHGRYRVQVPSATAGSIARSLPFSVGDGQSDINVRWSFP